MGVYKHKASLSDDAMEVDECMSTAIVVAKSSRCTESPRATATHAWNANVDPKALDVRCVEHAQSVPALHPSTRWTPFQDSAKPRYCRSMPLSRKRRLAEAAERPTKHLRLWEDQEAVGCNKSAHESSAYRATEETTAEGKPTRPRTLHFALPGLSSRETLQILGELVSVRFELPWLNSTRPVDGEIIPMFGWRSALWSIATPTGNDAVVYKSAKAFEGISVYSIARKLWTWQGLEDGFPEVSAPRHVYSISEGIRVVRQTDCLHGRAPHTSLWLEFIHNEGDSICMVRKELHRFQDTISGPKNASDRECQGYILHPLLVPVRSQVVAGAALHSIGSFRTRDLTAQNQIGHILANMPRHVLQWEDSFVHATSRV